MVKTNQQLQEEFRQRNKGGLLNLMISPEAKAQLARAAKHTGVTRRALIERLAADEESRILASMPEGERATYLASQLEKLSQKE